MQRSVEDWDSARLAGRRIVVTGGSGFIGSALVERLVGFEADVMVLDDFSTGRAENLTGALKNGLIESAVRECDIRTAEAAQAIKEWRPDVLVHLAAQASVPRANAWPARDADINIGGTIAMLDAAVQAGVGTVVFAASSAIYGRASGDQLPFAEDQPFAPQNPYGLSKATALAYSGWYATHHGLTCLALVPGNVYGAGHHGPSQGVVGRFTAAALGGYAPIVFGDGQQTRDFVHVDDVADAFARACLSTNTAVVNVATGVETSVMDVYDLISKAVGAGFAPQHVEPLPSEPRRVALDIRRAHRLLGWSPTTALAEGISKVVDRCREAVCA